MGIAILMVLEKLKAAVDHRWVSICLKCGTRWFGQDDECVCLVIVWFWVRGEQLQDVITGRSFPKISEVGPACNEISVCVKIAHESVPTIIPFAKHDHQIIAGEFLKGLCAEAAW